LPITLGYHCQAWPLLTNNFHLLNCKSHCFLSTNIISICTRYVALSIPTYGHFLSLVIGWVTKTLLSQPLPCYGRQVSRWYWLNLQSLAPTNLHRVCVVGYSPFSLCVIYKKGLYLRSSVAELSIVVLSILLSIVLLSFI
jgi:hypothetical protein